MTPTKLPAMRYLSFLLLFSFLLTATSCDRLARRRAERERLEHMRHNLEEQRKRLAEMRESLDEQRRDMDRFLDKKWKKLRTMKDLRQWLGENIRYPEEAMENGEEGKVYLQFTVTKDGAAENIRIVRSSGHPELDAEALVVVSNMPRWDGELLESLPADRVYRLPVSFKLE